MERLEQQQEYYQYGPGGWFFHEPPQLDETLCRELEQTGGRDRFGDPLYRLNWGGVAVIRTDPQDERPVVRGGREGTKINGGRIEPRYLFVQMQQAKSLCYKNDDSQTIRVAHASQVPPRALTWWEYEYVEYGQLRWFLERKLMPEQLVEAGIYQPDDPLLPARGDYICLLKIETPDGLYYEPDRAYLEAVKLSFYQAQNESLAKLHEMDAAGRARLAEEQAGQKRKREHAEFKQMTDDVIRADVNRVHSFPKQVRG